MAEAFFNIGAGQNYKAESAGTSPASDVNETVIAVMRELDIDLSNNRPKLLTQTMLDAAERVITMGCNVEEVCPANMTVTEDWGLEDPRDQSIEKVRLIRDEVRARVDRLIENLG
tara:strand:+ start:1433 stop:1777 length:345 start_codon:yes stop_codon:yes gene_type:complete